MAEEESAVLDAFLELVVVVAGVYLRVSPCPGFLEDVSLDVFQQFLHVFLDAFQGHGLFLERVSSHHFDGAVLDVSFSHHEPDGDALQLVVGKLEAGTFVVGVVILHADALGSQLFYDGSHVVSDVAELFFVLANGNDDHLDGSHAGWQHQAVVVAVGHDECANQSGAHAP